MTLSRRRVLKAGGALAGVSAAGLLVRPARGREAPAKARGKEAEASGRRIALLNLHTD